MNAVIWTTFLFLLLGSIIPPIAGIKRKKTQGEQDVVYSFSSVVYGDPPPGEIKQENNVISTLKVYKDTVYVTIPRNGGALGIPATLATIGKGGNNVLFKPFPSSWASQAVGNCEALQSVTGIEVKADLMYIADNGGYNCKAKLAVYDLVKRKFTLKHEFQIDVVESPAEFGDIVVDGEGFVYIANSQGFGSIIVYDSKTQSTKIFSHRLFKSRKLVSFVFGNETFNSSRNVCELTLSSDNKFLLFSTQNIYLNQASTDTLRKKKADHSKDLVRGVGSKMHPGMDIIMGQKYMYFSNLVEKSVTYWDRNGDIKRQQKMVPEPGLVVMETKNLLKIKPDLSLYPGKMSLDGNGYLWLVTMDYPLYFVNRSSNANLNTKIVKIFLEEEKYVSKAGRVIMSVVIVAVCSLFFVL